MAFSAVTERGSAFTKASGTTVGVSPSGDITVGKVAWALCVTDNTTLVDGPSTDHTSVTDTDGHTWTKVFEGTETQAAAAADGVTVSLWWTKVVTQIDTTDTVTLTIGTARLAKAIGLFEVTVGAGNTVQLADSTVLGVTSSTNPAAMVLSGLPSKEYLFLGVAGNEGAQLTWTEDADYTNVYAAEGFGSTGTPAASNVAGNVGARIFTGTGDTFDVGGMENTEHYLGFAAFEEVSAGGTQSLTGTLFTNAATFPTGVVSQAGGTQTLTGILFVKAPTVPTGTVSAGGTTRTHYDTQAFGTVTSGTSVAFTPTANSILLCFTLGRLDTGVPTPTVTGHGLVWEIIGASASSNARAGWLFAAWVGASPSNGTVTVDYGAALDMAFSIVGEAGTATGTLQEVIRVLRLYATDTERTSYAVHQQAFVDPANDALGFWYIGQNVTAVVGSGWTELGQAKAGSVTALAMGRVGEGLVIDASWPVISHIGAIFGCEVRHAGSPAFGPVRDARWLTRGFGTSGTTITTDSITPTAEALVCVLISSGRSTGPQTPTSVVGNGITYTLAGSVDFSTVAAPLWRFSVWTGSAAAPTAGTVVVTFPGNQSEGRRWAIFEVDDVTSVVQIATDAEDAPSSMSATLGAFTHVNNPVFGVLAAASVQAWPVPGSGFQHVALVNTISQTNRLWGIWRGSNDTTVDIAVPTVSNAAFIALELEAAPVGVSQIPNATTSNVGWDTAPLAGQAIHTYIASDDTNYITVTVP